MVDYSTERRLEAHCASRRRPNSIVTQQLSSL
jgi:hypothetical protein